MPRALVTGIGGQDGSMLAELLVERGYEVIGTVRDPERDHGAAVVSPLRIAPNDGVGDDTELSDWYAEVRERPPPAFGVDDDPLEAAERAPPEGRLVRRPPWQQVVCCQHQGRAMAKQPGVDFRCREPLHMDDVGADGGQPRETERVLERLHRQSEP